MGEKHAPWVSQCRLTNMGRVSLSEMQRNGPRRLRDSRDKTKGPRLETRGAEVGEMVERSSELRLRRASDDEPSGVNWWRRTGLRPKVLSS